MCRRFDSGPHHRSLDFIGAFVFLNLVGSLNNLKCRFPRRVGAAHTTEASILSGLLYFMHFVYVIYSPSSDRYYIGETVDVQGRLIEHRQHRYAGSFTSIADDWEIAFVLRCKDKVSALKVEAHLKKSKSKVYLKRLQHEEMALKKLKEILDIKYSIEVI